MYDRLKIISLTANNELAENIAKILGVEIIPSNIIHFADGETLFEANKTFRGDNVYIIQSTCSPVNDRLMEVLVCIDACKRASAKSITCVIPYYGYARQDRKVKARQPITARLVADLLTVAGANKVVCVDLHSAEIGGFFSIPVDNVAAMPLFHQYFNKYKPETTVCVSPDHGGVVRTTNLAKKLNCPIAIIDKRRPEPNKAEITAIVGDIAGKDCILVDDILDTAGTLCAAAEKLMELGAKSVHAAVTHGVLSSPAVERIQASPISEVVITDSIPLPKEKQIDKIKVISLAPILSRTMAAMEDGQSLSEVYQKYDQELNQ